MYGDGGATGGFPRALLRVILIVFSFQRGLVGLGVAARDNLRGHHCRIGLFLRHPPHALHLTL